MEKEVFIDDFMALSWGIQHQGVWDTPWLLIPGAEFPARPGTMVRIVQVAGGYEARRIRTIRAQVEGGLAQMGVDDERATEALVGELEDWFEGPACEPGDWMAWRAKDGVHFQMRFPSLAWSGERRFDLDTGKVEMC